jgi:mono/diheme cytochrome c family protein
MPLAVWLGMMTLSERPDPIGRVLLLSIAIWGAVGLVVLVGFELIFPVHATQAMSRADAVCKASVAMGDFAPPSDPLTRIIAAPSRCFGDRPPVAEATLHAYLEGAELEGSPVGPSPAVDAPLLARGAALYQHHCAACHGAAGDGRGPDTCALTTPVAIHARGVFALRSTEHEALPTDQDLFRTITRGVHGTAMPPWTLLPEPDRWALVAHVKSLSTQFSDDTAPAPVELGTAPPITSERLAHGRELYKTRGCASCHGDSGRGDGPGAAALAFFPRDFTSGRFHKGNSLDDLHATLVTGLDGTPMASFVTVMTPAELWDTAIYVQSLIPRFVARNGIRCPVGSIGLDPQELFGLRHLLHTLDR